MATTPVLIKSTDSSNNVLPVSLSSTGEVNIAAASSLSVTSTTLALETTASAMSAKLPATLGQKAKASSLAVTLASDEDTLATSSAQLPSSLGQTTKAASTSVTLASDQGAITVSSTLSAASSSDSLTITSGSTDTSVSKDTAGYSKIGVVLESDKTDTEAQIKWSHDDVTYYAVESKQVVTSTADVGGGSAINSLYYILNPIAKYVRVDVKNPDIASATVKVLVNLH